MRTKNAVDASFRWRRIPKQIQHRLSVDRPWARADRRAGRHHAIIFAPTFFETTIDRNLTCADGGCGKLRQGSRVLVQSGATPGQTHRWTSNHRERVRLLDRREPDNHFPAAFDGGPPFPPQEQPSLAGLGRSGGGFRPILRGFAFVRCAEMHYGSLQ